MDLSPTPLTAACRAVALLIDGQNIAAALAPSALSAARRLGPVATSRVYGDARSLGPWHEVPGLRVQHAHAGKNITDMLLTVEAMELSHSGAIDGFALATNDRDFTSLAQSLRSRGFPVLGLVGAAAPPMFRDSCSLVMTLIAAPVPGAAVKPHPTPVPPPPADPAKACARALLGRKPWHPGDFAKAMQAAGHTIPMGHANWRAWLKASFPTLAIRGTGQEALFSLLP